MSGHVKYAYLGLLAIMLATTVVPVPVYLHMIVSTLLIIYIGSHQSVAAEVSAEGMEQMSSRDAYMFPLIGSAFLFSLYLVYKLLDKEYVNILVKAYFFLFGVLILANNIHKVLSILLDKDTFHKWDAELFRCKIPFVGHEAKPTDKPAETGKKEPKTVQVAPASESSGPAAAASSANTKSTSDGKTIFSVLDLVCYALAIVFGVWYVVYNHWTANNIFGICFSIQGIELLSLGTFFNGLVLLCGLFVYDVFWVFGTDVMVTVAKSFDAPIKLLFPRGAGQNASMLGLGDIVIPGIFIALMLRFDASLARQGYPRSKWHFWATMIGYFVGLSTTVGVMYYFEAAQPALLYLVPTCLGSSTVGGALSGHFHALINFSEEKTADATATTATAADGAGAANATAGTPQTPATSVHASSSDTSPSDTTTAAAAEVPAKQKKPRSKKMD